MPKPNVLILHADQQRCDSLGCTGNPHARTPNIDRLAGEGSVFTRHIVSNPVCMPSRASLLTGLYPPGHNVYSNGVKLNRRREYGPAELIDGKPAENHEEAEPATLADMLRAGGYATAAFGKLHLTPTEAAPHHGFGESHRLHQDGMLRDWRGPYYGFDHFEVVKSHGENPCHRGHYADWLQTEHQEAYRQVLAARPPEAYPVPGQQDLYASALPAELHNSMWLADRFEAWLQARGQAEEPFFAFVGFPDPHHPFTPPAEILAEFEDARTLAPYDPEGAWWRALPDAADVGGRGIGHLEPAQRRHFRRATNAMVHLIDRAVGRIVASLQRRGLWENTVVVFTSDHGDFLGDHGLLYKREVGCDSLLHVPLILRAPGAELPATIDLPVSNVDVTPTLAALCGVETPALHGVDLAAKIREGAPHEALAYCSGTKGTHNNFTRYDERFRLTVYPACGFVELYDHREDPGETRNLASERPEYVREVRARLGEALLAHYDPIQGKLSPW